MSRSAPLVPAIQRSTPLRLLTLTTLFPNALQPRHGIFIANRLRRLCASGRVEASVVAAVPWFPGMYGATAGVPLEESLSGLRVRHPRYLNIPAVGMGRQPASLARAILRDLRRSGVDSRGFDVVDAHYFYPDGVAAASVADALGLPLVISARGSDINLIGGIAFARRRMLAAADRAQALIAVSAALRARMIELGMPGERIHVLRNGVDTELFAPYPRSEARTRAGLDPGDSWILGVGNLVPEKGFDLLIRVLPDLPHARLLLVGEGPLRGSLETLAAKLAPGRVKFSANMLQPELRFAYAACDVLGVPSLREGWPNVVLESIACGTPVVASAVGGIPEILRPGSPARVVADRSVAAWREALASILGSAQEPGKVREHALQFGWDEVVTAQCALYESVASRCTQAARKHA